MSTFSNEQLAVMAQAGDSDALLQLWKQVKRYCLWRARRWTGRGTAEADDFEQAGFEALCDAVKTFSSERGSFLDLFDYGLRRAFYVALYGSRTKRAASDPIHDAVSLNAEAADDSDTELWELLPGDADTDATAEERERTTAVRAALDILTEAERAVILAIFYGEMTQDAAAARLNISSAEVRKAEAAALRKLRHPSISQKLQHYL